MSDADKTAPVAANDNDLFNVEEAANFLRLKRSTLDHYRCEGRGPIYRKHGRHVRYHIDDLNDWSNLRKKDSTADDK